MGDKVDSGWLDDVLDGTITTLYVHRRALRRALHYFDCEMTGRCDRNALFHALEGLAAALAQPEAPFNRVQIESLVKHIPTDDAGLIQYEELLDSFVLVDTFIS